MYREDKTTQAAAIILERLGGKLTRLKLIKLLYLADREMLITRGRPISYDRWYSLDNGPILSETYDRIKEASSGYNSYWAQHIRSAGQEVMLAVNPDNGTLSKAEKAVIDCIVAKYGQMTPSALRNYTHRLAEYKDPNRSRIEIKPEEILKASGLAPDEIAKVVDNIELQGSSALLASYQ